MRILLAELHPSARYALTVLLNGQPGWETVGFAGTVDEVLAKTAELQPDVVLLDEQIYDSDPRDFDDFWGRSDRPRVVVIGTDPASESGLPGAGVDHFFSKMETSEKLMEILRDCAKDHKKQRTTTHRRHEQSRYIAM
jgi:DNA-binding NarL/FixJ family response regulator